MSSSNIYFVSADGCRGGEGRRLCGGGGGGWPGVGGGAAKSITAILLDLRKNTLPGGFGFGPFAFLLSKALANLLFTLALLDREFEVVSLAA